MASSRLAAVSALLVLSGCRATTAPDDDPAKTGSADGGGVEPPARDAGDAASVTAPDARVNADARRLPADVTPYVEKVDVAPPPPTGGPSPPCTFQLCESFESYADGDAPDPAIWSRSSGDVVVGSKRAARGTRALHIPNVASGAHIIQERRTFPAMKGAFFARVFLWVEQQPALKVHRTYHWTLLEASGRGPLLRLGGLTPSPTENKLIFNVESGGSGETYLGDKNGGLEIKVWHCFEVYFDTPNNVAAFWWNGYQRQNLFWMNHEPTFPQYKFGEVEALSFGWTEYQEVTGDLPWDIWIDEIAVDDKRIRCTQ